MHLRKAHSYIFQFSLLLFISCSLVACFGGTISPTPIPTATVALPVVEEPNIATATQEADSQDSSPQTDVGKTTEPSATEPSTPLPEPTATATLEQPTITPLPDTPVPATATPQETEPNIQTIAPIASEQSQPPMRLEISQLERRIPIVPMGWQVTTLDDVQTTEWVVPDAAAGWHINSANPGTLGNVILSGHQQIGEAVFADLAIGEVTIDQIILLVDEADRTFVYQVVDVASPIPIAGATPGEEALAQSYIAPSTIAKLTLITGWPDFTTTHRLFVVADFIGLLDE